MFKKRYLTILLFLMIAICAISTVNAENITNTDAMNSNESPIIDETTSNEAINDKYVNKDILSVNNNADSPIDENNKNEDILSVYEDTNNPTLDKSNENIIQSSEITNDKTAISQNSNKEILSDNPSKTIKISFYKTTGKYYNNKKIYYKVTDANTGKALKVNNLDFKIYDPTDNSYIWSVTGKTNSKGIGVITWYPTDLGYGSFIIKSDSTQYIYDYSEGKTITAKCNAPSKKIIVAKFKVTIKANKLITFYKSNKKFKIRLIGQDKKPVQDAIVKLKIYTGKKCKTVFLQTNSKGVDTYKISKLNHGAHRVVISLDGNGYDNNAGLYAKSVSTYIKIKDNVKISITHDTSSIGGLITFNVKSKQTNKFTNGIPVKIKVYTGSKSKTFNLVTGKDPDTKKKGAVGIATNIFSAGTHKIKLIINTNKYKGTATSKIKIPNSAKYYVKWIALLSKGKTSFKAYK